MATRSNHALSRVGRVVLIGIVANVLVVLALAPVLTVGWCLDAPAGGVSICHSEPRSLLGGYAPWWLWLPAQIVAIVATVVVARRARDAVPS